MKNRIKLIKRHLKEAKRLIRELDGASFLHRDVDNMLVNIGFTFRDIRNAWVMADKIEKDKFIEEIKTIEHKSFEQEDFNNRIVLTIQREGVQIKLTAFFKEGSRQSLIDKVTLDKSYI